MVTASSQINNFQTAAVARHILLSIFVETAGIQRAACRLSNLPEATAPACLTDEGRRLAIKQAN